MVDDSSLVLFVLGLLFSLVFVLEGVEDVTELSVHPSPLVTGKVVILFNKQTIASCQRKEAPSLDENLSSQVITAGIF